MTSNLRVAGMALAALFALAHGGLGQPPQVAVQISPYLLRLTHRAVVDLGAGVIEAEGVSTRVEAPPAVQAAREARQDALDNLREALPLLPTDSRSRVADWDPGRLEVVLEAALEAPIVAEWDDAEGRVHAVARLELWEGPDSLLALLLDLAGQPETEPTEAPLPALIVELRGAEPIGFALLPRLLLSGQDEPALTEHWRALARGMPPTAYAPGMAKALAMLKEGQPSVVLYGRPDPENGIDVLLDGDSLERLEAAHLPLSFEAIDRVILTLGP